jgi:hypothetical protein
MNELSVQFALSLGMPRCPRARSFLIEALCFDHGLRSWNVNLALNILNRAGFTLRPKRCGRGKVIPSEAILL